MTPKEKAKELVDLYCQLLAIRSYENKDKAKQCALICVDEIIKSNPMIEYGYTDAGTEYKSNKGFWYEVKEEINKL